ncbi:MAG: glycosyltransferase family 4 protein [Chloroflexota bacterium]
MRIIYLGTISPHPGGAAIAGSQLLGGLAARGHAVQAVAGTTEPIEERERRDRMDMAGVTTFRYAIRQNVVEGASLTLGALRSIRPGLRSAVRRAIAEGCPEIVVSGRSDFAPDALVVARALRVPMVQMEHRRDGGALCADDPLCAQAVRHAYRRADVVVLVARHLRAAHAWIPRAVVIPNAVESDRFRPMPRDPELAACLGIPPDTVVVLHASNLKIVKRAQDIVAAIPAVLERVPGTRFVFLGDGSDREAIAAAVAAAGLTEHVHLVGWQPREAMPRWYALADIVVMPSTTEAMSLVGLEATAAGRVLVASDIPAFRETVTDGEDGLLVPVMDVPALADRIATAAADPGVRARIGAAARARVARRSMDGFLAEWETVLAQAVATSRADRANAQEPTA